MTNATKFCGIGFLLLGLMCVQGCSKTREPEKPAPASQDSSAPAVETKESSGVTEAVASRMRSLTLAQMRSLQTVIANHMSLQGQAPVNLDSLRQANPHLQMATDAWGTPIKYERMSEISFKLISAGRDKFFDTDDDIVLEY